MFGPALCLMLESGLVFGQQDVSWRQAIVEAGRCECPGLFKSARGSAAQPRKQVAADVAATREGDQLVPILRYSVQSTVLMGGAGRR